MSKQNHIDPYIVASLSGPEGTEIEVCRECGHVDHLVGWGQVRWEPDSTILVEGSVEIWN